MAKIAKRMQKVNEGVDRNKLYPLLMKPCP
jgi:hypothetical protein